MTHKHEHEEKDAYRKLQQYKCKESILRFKKKTVQWKYCANQIKLCCNPFNEFFFLNVLSCWGVDGDI